jgi:hypothetical protein
MYIQSFRPGLTSPALTFRGKNEDQIAERFDGNSKLVKICIDALSHIHLITKNSLNEIVLTPDSKNYLEKFDSDR